MPVNNPAYRLLVKLQRAAEQELSLILKSLPKEIAEQIKSMSFRFDDRPSAAMTGRGVDRDQFSLTDREAATVHIFLMNLHDRFAATPGELRRELRRAILKEVADWVGMELFGDEAS